MRIGISFQALFNLIKSTGYVTCGQMHPAGLRGVSGCAKADLQQRCYAGFLNFKLHTVAYFNF